jgi:hypothetical protein
VERTVRLCDTGAPPACAEKVREEGVTDDMVCALTVPAASNTREISAEFNVFK